jgi:glycosyltransferase involved in cell wall biosynthesis
MNQSSAAPRKKKPKIVAGLPAFNEEKYIGTIILKTRRYVEEVIVVDDGSSDQTAEVARLAGAVVVQHRQNQGYGASIKTLLSEARERKADIFVLLDADAQHNPDEIPVLAGPIEEGFDIVIGSRRERKEDVPRYRRAGQKVIGYFSRILSGARLADSESGFRAFSARAIASLQLKENGMAVSAETISRATETGLKITERPISIRYTGDGSTLNPVAHGLGVLGRIIVMISERRPLFFFGLGGLTFVVLGFLAGLRAAAIIFTGGNAVNGWSLVAIVLIVLGVCSIFTGIMLNVLIKRGR